MTTTLQNIKCEQCGGKLEQEYSDLYICRDCGRVYKPTQIRKMMEDGKNARK